MAIPTGTARVKALKQWTHDVRELTFELIEPAQVAFEAGQYINFRVPDPTREGKIVSRLYSLSTPPSQQGELGVVYNYVGGPGTLYLQSLTVGQEFEYKGPMGHFTLKQDSQRDVLFAATGTGVAPFYSILLEELAKGNTRQFTLLWGVRAQRDLYYQDELRALEAQYSNFTFLMPLSKPEDGWDGLTGRITAVFPDHVTSVDNLEVYACGNDQMIKDIKALCLALGECPFYREKYF